jgi:hypothetical protein
LASFDQPSSVECSRPSHCCRSLPFPVHGSFPHLFCISLISYCCSTSHEMLTYRPHGFRLKRKKFHTEPQEMFLKNPLKGATVSSTCLKRFFPFHIRFSGSACASMTAFTSCTCTCTCTSIDLINSTRQLLAWRSEYLWIHHQKSGLPRPETAARNDHAWSSCTPETRRC